MDARPQSDDIALAVHDVQCAADLLAHADRATLRHHEHELTEAHERLTLIVQSIQTRKAA